MWGLKTSCYGSHRGKEFINACRNERMSFSLKKKMTSLYSWIDTPSSLLLSTHYTRLSLSGKVVSDPTSKYLHPPLKSLSFSFSDLSAPGFLPSTLLQAISDDLLPLPTDIINSSLIAGCISSALELAKQPISQPADQLHRFLPWTHFVCEWYQHVKLKILLAHSSHNIYYDSIITVMMTSACFPSSQSVVPPLKKKKGHINALSDAPVVDKTHYAFYSGPTSEKT